MKYSDVPQKGFSLLELITAIAIIALLLTIALPSYHRYSERLSVIDARHKLLEIMHLENRYFSEQSTYTIRLVSDLGVESLVSDRGDYRIVASTCGSGIRHCVELKAVATTDRRPDLIIDSSGNKSPPALWK